MLLSWQVETQLLTRWRIYWEQAQKDRFTRQWKQSCLSCDGMLHMMVKLGQYAEKR